MPLKIIKGLYFDPNIGPENGTDVTDELSAEIRDGNLIYKGVYNRIFPDHFRGIYKRLKIEVEYNSKNFTRFYNEDDKIDLPHDLGTLQDRWNNRWIQIVFLIGALASIIGLINYRYQLQF